MTTNNEVSIEQRTPEWFAQRKGKITASNVGAILGLNPYRTAKDVMRAMVREFHGAESEFKGNIATEYGTRHEADALAEFELIQGVKVDPVGFVQSKEYDWLGGSPDGLIGNDSTVEAKCPFGMRKITNTDDFKSIEEQPHYYAQIQICLHATKRSRCAFIQWASFAGVKVEVVLLSDAWLSDAIPKLKAFYLSFILECENPDAHLEPLVKTLPKNVLVDEYLRIKSDIIKLEERQSVIIDEIRTLAGDKPAKFGTHKLTKIVRKGSISYSKAIKDIAPDADLEAYRGSPSTSWSIR